MNYIIIVRQWPKQGVVSCGMGRYIERNLPQLDPPIILQLGRINEKGIIDTSVESLGNLSHLVMNATLLDRDGKHAIGAVVDTAMDSLSTIKVTSDKNVPLNTMVNTELVAEWVRDDDVSHLVLPLENSSLDSSNKPTDCSDTVYPMIGTLVSPCELLNDLDGQKAAFFVFSDIGIRVPGEYRFQFSLKRLAFDRKGPVDTVYACITDTFQCHSSTDAHHRIIRNGK